MLDMGIDFDAILVALVSTNFMGIEAALEYIYAKSLDGIFEHKFIVQTNSHYCKVC